MADKKQQVDESSKPQVASSDKSQREDKEFVQILTGEVAGGGLWSTVPTGNFTSIRSA